MNSTTKAAPTTDALEILRTDHRRLLELFRDFDHADEGSRKRIAGIALDELSAHSAMEAKIFYPGVAKRVKGARAVVLEGQESHHVANILITELRALPFGETYVAKFHELARGVTAHIEEEEEVLLPLVEGSRLDLASLGREMAAFKADYFACAASESVESAGMGGKLLLAAMAAAGYAVYRRLGSEKR